MARAGVRIAAPARAVVASVSLALVGGCPGPQGPDPGHLSPPPAPDLEVDRIPMETTPSDRLSTDQLRHSELLRIKRNFGKETFEIVLDVWVATADPRRLADARLWWLRTDHDDERSPFGAGTRSNFEIEYEQPGPDHWRVHLISDRKRFTFDIEVDDTGTPRAFTTVVAGGESIAHCETRQGMLHARRLLGAPIGIKRLDVTCTDDEGAQHEGEMLAGATRG